jgi:hypothetical protein
MYMRDLRQQRRRIGDFPPDEQEILLLELEEMDEERENLKNIVQSDKDFVATAKRKLGDAKKDDRNSKSMGQPLRSQFDDVLYKHGIDRSGMFGGAIDGNACRRLMANADAIVSEFLQIALASESKVAGISDDLIRSVCRYHLLYLHSLDGFLSCILTPRFQLTVEIGNKTEEYSEICLKIERYLGLSITPKSHIQGMHAAAQQRLHRGIGDLDESFGERNHQYESIADRRHGGTRDFARREKIKSKEQANFSHADVKAKVLSLQLKRKRPPRDEFGVQVEAAMKKQKRAEARAAILELEVPTNTVLPRLRDEAKRLLLQT